MYSLTVATTHVKPWVLTTRVQPLSAHVSAKARKTSGQGMCSKKPVLLWSTRLDALGKEGVKGAVRKR